MLLTLIEGYRPLAKIYTKEGVQSYPLVKTVTSHPYFIPDSLEGLEQKTEILRKHARLGHALMKGPFLRTLHGESRAGQTDNTALTRHIVIDIDGVTLPGISVRTPLNRADIQQIATACVTLLPPEFHNVCYVAHASSSLGLKGDRVSMHLDFMLDHDMTTEALKRWLQWMNLTQETFADQLDLTATGTALRYKLDPSLADNSRIIYIATPIFENVENPIPDENDRIFLVKPSASAKTYVTVPEVIRGLKKGAVSKALGEKLIALREQKGLPPSKAMTRSMNIDGEFFSVVTNPDACSMVYHRESETYVYYNINGGDSNAYYVNKVKPYVVRNFKGEPAFLFEQADPTTYQLHIDTFIKGNAEAESNFAPTPVVFNDAVTDVNYRGLVNRISNTVIEMHPCSRVGMADWLTQFNGVPSENVPVFNYVFDPTDPRTVDIPQRFINRYTPSELMSNPPDIDDRFKGLTPQTCLVGEELCPNIFKILRSVTGHGEKELPHFINWLAYIIRERKKTQTAWVFHGIEGTGKGVLFERVLKPILGRDYAVQIRVETLDEQFNAWLEKALIVMVDEFEYNASKNKKGLLNKLKNYITEPNAMIRGMRENARSVPNFANFILNGNERDMMRPGDEDRRYNIAPRQEHKLFETYPELEGNLDCINAETPAFTAMMSTFNYVEIGVREALNNDAKRTMRAAARTVVEDFVGAVKSGDLEFFVDVLDREDTMGLDSALPAAKNVLRTIIRRYNAETGTAVFTDGLLQLFKVMVGDTKTAPVFFGKMLSRHGLDSSQRVRINGKQGRGLVIKFHHPDIETLRAEYLQQDTPGNVAQFQPRSE